MAARTSAGQSTATNGTGQDIAINKTRGLAFSRSGEQDEWRAIDPKGLTGLQEMQRVSHTKIGDNWFSVYRSGSGK